MAVSPLERATVHVVDDDESLRTAVARLLRAAGYETRTYASAGEFALAQSEQMSGCVLLDVRMPGPSGLDLQEALARSKNPLPVVFLTAHGDIPMSVGAMKAGAVDFLTKPVQREELLAAVNAALAREHDSRKSRHRLGVYRERWNSLTSREREVLSRVTAGQPNKRIAVEMSVAERTVKAHRARVMEKMGATSLADLVQMADELRRSPN